MGFEFNNEFKMPQRRLNKFAQLCEEHGVYEKREIDENGNKYIILQTSIHFEGLDNWVKEHNIKLPNIWKSFPNESHKDFAKRLGWLD